MSDILDRLNKAVDKRERGELDTSRVLFEELLNAVKENDPEYLELCAEYVIQVRLEAKLKYAQALKIGRQLLAKYPNEPAAIRAVVHPLSDLAAYESTPELFMKMIKLHSNNSLKMGEEQAHLAFTFLRTNKADEAKDLIEEALINIRLNNQNVDYKEVRESYALMVKSLIQYDLGMKDQAKATAKEAHEVAKAGRAVLRVRQTEELLSLFGDD